MKQSRTASITETVLNMSSGALLSMGFTEALAPYLGISITGTANIKLTLVLTVVSFCRSYLWRRYFNSRTA